MADPLSISASIAGLVALADLVFRSGTKYVKSYRGAPTEVGNLIREVKSLSVILHNLSLVAFGLEEIEPPEPTAAVHEPLPVLQPHHLHDCHQLLRRLETGLSRTEASLDSGSGRQRLRARLLWPFTSTESREMIQDIQRYNQIIHIALAADSLAKLKDCLTRQVEMKDDLQKINRTAGKILDIQVKIALDAKRNQVIKDFDQVNPRGEYETNNRLRHGLTGLWLTQSPEFNYWYSTPASRLWCSGIPGAGKSVLSAAVIKECLHSNAHDAHKATGYFFCTYRHERSQHLVTILSSLCIQLALQSENAFLILQAYHDQLFSCHRLSTKPTAEMLTQILHCICACFARVYIIVDGIDECGNRVEANIKCLAELATSQGNDVINMALFSRDESIIRTRLERDFSHVEIEAHTEDLQLYVASELSERIASKRLRLRDQTLKDLITTRLVGEAKGMFRWVACQLDYMCELPTDRARLEALSKLPPSLYATYDRILLRIDGYNEAVKRLVKGALLMLATSFSSLCFEEICEAISLVDGATTLEDDEIIEEEELLRWCSSLVRVNKSGSFADGKRIQFAYFTVQEYLQSLKTRNSDHQYPQLRDYAVSRVDGINFFSFLCSRFLTMEAMERFPPTPDITRSIGDMLAQRRRRTFYCKSVLTWTPYTTPSSKMGDRTRRLLRKLFHPSKTPSFCLWAIDFIFSHHPSSSNTSEESKRILSQVITAVLRPEFTPLHMAAAFSLYDICQELLESGSDVLACSRFGTPLHCALGGRGFFYGFLNLGSNDVISGGPITDRIVFHSTHLARLRTVQLLLNVSVSPLTSLSPSETIISLTLSCPEIFTNNVQVIIELLRAGVPITAHDVQLFQIRYDRCLQIPAFTSDTSPMWSLFPQLLKVLGENLTPGCPRLVLRQETADFILRASKIRQPQCPVGQSLDGASSEEVLKYFHSLIILNDGIGMSAFLTTSRADMAKSTDIDPKRPGWNALHLALFQRSYRVLDPLLAFGLDPCAESPEGFKPVHMCCRENAYEALQILLRFGGSILDTDNLGRTVWHLAAELNSGVLLKELLDLGVANTALKITSKHHETPICAAATQLHLEAVSLLLPFCKTEEHWTSSKALAVILYEPRFSGVIQSLHAFGILSQTSCGMHALACAFYRAILLNDVQTCEKLYGLGCPLECELPFPVLVTPLALAISQGSYKVMMWLFRKGAPVSTIMAHPTKDTHCTVLDLFLERPNLNNLLSTLLDVYLAERGSFAHEQRSILNIPLVSGNTDGLIIMLNKLHGKALGCGEVTRFFLDISGDFVFKSTSRLESLSAIIDQKDIRHQNRTPLFVAAAQNNVKAANALLIPGADVNATDDKNCTPLFVAVEQGAIEVVELLIGRGAHVDVMSTSSYGLLDVAFVQKSWRMVEILLKVGLSSKRINVDGRNLLGLMTLWTCQPDTKPNIGLFKRLLDHGVDLYVCDKFGSSASHYLFTRSCRCYLLCMLDMRLDLQVDKLSSWPDHFFSNGVDNLFEITYSLRYVKPSIGIEGVRQLCGLGTPGTHGLLCRAACWGSVKSIQNLINLGINDLEHDCREHGLPLNAAIHNRRWEAVKFLMLHGAKVPEDLWKPKNSTLSTANPDFVIREWLFVGRYTERKRISLDLLNDEPEIKSWSGVWVVRVPLQWRDRKCSVESTLEYVKRRHWLEIEYKSSTIGDTQLARPKERRGSMSSVVRQGYC
ncbi:Vegetative incompatibility HET-E-1 [Fusarium agapanthi]|uniref:Vegetative incompatibility HET-E-1 n=1 Tax=Fusarium agapanthi TaxID=1803897 RepID=A0A9P5EBZ0_9HYPO|nr:Vegetative incompatibility HET-E-1 [Fusarium agapanthi]